MPSLEPDYRAGRPHREFITNLNVPAESVKAAMIKEWQAESPSIAMPLENLTRLVREKYATREWNFKF